MRTQRDVDDNQVQRDREAQELEKNRQRAVEMRETRQARQKEAHDRTVAAPDYVDPVDKFRKLMGTEKPKPKPHVDAITNMDRYPG